MTSDSTYTSHLKKTRTDLLGHLRSHGFLQIQDGGSITLGDHALGDGPSKPGGTAGNRCQRFREIHRYGSFGGGSYLAHVSARAITRCCLAPMESSSAMG